MTDKKSATGYITAMLLGVALWLSISRISGMPEAWDSRLYFVYGIPIMMIVSFALGYICFHRPWRWPVTIVASQALLAIAQNPSANLLPLGLIAFGILAIPGLLSAFLGAFLRNRLTKR